MIKADYKKLIDCRFLDNYSGSVKYYWSNDEKPYNPSDINAKVLEDLNTKLDYNNIIILFPLASNCGINTLLGATHQNSFPIDHCTYPIDVREFLNDKGITFKNNIKLTDRKYSQMNYSILIIQDGIAYVGTGGANPYNGNKSYHQSNFASEIKITDQDLTHLNFDNKEIIFSGVLVERIRQNIK